MLTAQVEHLQKKRATLPAIPKTPVKTGRNKDSKWAWKDIMPKEGEPTTKSFQGKDYHVNCKFHPKQWVCHSSSECFKNPNLDDSAPASASSATSDDGTAIRLQASQLAAAMLEIGASDNQGAVEGLPP